MSGFITSPGAMECQHSGPDRVAKVFHLIAQTVAEANGVMIGDLCPHHHHQVPHLGLISRIAVSLGTFPL